MDYELLPGPVAVMEMLDVPAEVVGVEDPPHATIPADPARQVTRSTAQNTRRARNFSDAAKLLTSLTRRDV